MFDLMKDAFAVDGFDQMEVYAERERSITVGVEGGDVSSSEASESFGIGIRVLADGTIGFASTSRRQGVKEAAERAVRLANVSQGSMISLPLSFKGDRVDNTYDQDLATMDIERLTGEVTRAVDRQVSVVEGQVSRSVGERYLVNSNGIEQQEKGTMLSAMASVQVDNVSKYWFDASRNFFDPGEVVDNAASLAEKSVGARMPRTGERTVILSPYAQYQLFTGLLYPAFDADRVQNGLSFFEGSRGEQVADPSLTVVDDGRKERGLYSRSFDREGTPQQRTTLVENGELVSFLYDVRRAEEEGLSSTGNAFGGYTDQPSIRPSNFVVNGESGERPDSGLFVQDVAGVHTADETTGEYAVNVTTGFDVGEEGMEPVKGGLIVGDIRKLLRSFSHLYGERRTVDSLTTANAVFNSQRVVSDD